MHHTRHAHHSRPHRDGGHGHHGPGRHDHDTHGRHDRDEHGHDRHEHGHNGRGHVAHRHGDGRFAAVARGRHGRPAPVIGGRRPGAVLEAVAPAGSGGAALTAVTPRAVAPATPYSSPAGAASCGEGCPKTGGAGVCIGDCRACPYRRT